MRLPSPLPDHPRLLADPADWGRIRTQRLTDGPTATLWSALQRRADALLLEAPVERVMTGRLLLMISRQALERISLLALIDRVSGDRRYGRRAIAEMLAVCRFTDWNPSHFLDTAEICLAISIGYDWLYDELRSHEAEEIESAMVHKGIRPSLDEQAPSNWWLAADENWVQVCHGGLSAAAIVLADRFPALAQLVLDRALAALPAVAERYAPDGGYPEGPMYWSYGTAYHVVLAAALLRLTGSTEGTDAYPGFAASAEYINQVTAPSGDYFNYADCAPRRRLQAQLFWMADRYGHPGWLAYDLLNLETDVAEYLDDPGVQYWYYDMLSLALLWHRPGQPSRPVDAAAFWSADGPMPVACYRRRLHNLFLGVKGGSVGLSHSHMDVGSFVFEAGGVRWAIDPGMQDYDSLETAGVDLWNEREQSSQRWRVFRIGPDSHNTLRATGRDQPLFRRAPLIANETSCTVDLSALFDHSGEVHRLFTPANDGFLLEDRWAFETALSMRLQWLTYAEIEQRPTGLLLRQANATLELAVSVSGCHSLSIEDAAAPTNSFDAGNPGLKAIAIVTEASRQGRIVIGVRLCTKVAPLDHPRPEYTSKRRSR